MSKSNYHNGSKNNRCYFCNAIGTEEHHVVPQRFGGEDRRDNVVELCSQCHNRLERLYDKSFYEWFGIDDEQGKRKHHRPCQHQGCNNQATVHWRNKMMGSDFYMCDTHVNDVWHEKAKFVFVEELD